MGAGRRMCELGDQLATDLSCPCREHSRSLFTNAYPELGPLSTHLQALSLVLKHTHNLQRKMLMEMEKGVQRTILSFLELDVLDADKMKGEVWQLGSDYEGLLIKTLDSQESLEGPYSHELYEARKQFELSRFDMVQYLNQIDGKKKLRLVSGVNRIQGAYHNYFKEGATLWETAMPVAEKRGADLVAAEKNSLIDTNLWKSVRSRLEAELQGTTSVA